MTVGNQFGDISDCVGPMLTGLIAFSEVSTIIDAHFKFSLESQLTLLREKIEKLAVTLAQN
jgi:hypothetical protein